jgi:hypothetical protein
MDGAHRRSGLVVATAGGHDDGGDHSERPGYGDGDGEEDPPAHGGSPSRAPLIP